MNQKNLEKFQKDLGDICIFLGMNKCKHTDYSPEKCIHGDYSMCDNYWELKEKYIEKKDE